MCFANSKILNTHWLLPRYFYFCLEDQRALDRASVGVKGSGQETDGPSCDWVNPDKKSVSVVDMRKKNI